MPLFSVIVPAYNNERHIRAAVQSAIDQTLSDIEIVIVYDPCADNTESIIDELAQSNEKITVIKNAKRAGVAESRNMGMMKASGEYVAFLDADDIWLSDKLSRQYDLILKTKCDICYSSYSFIDENNESTGRPFIVSEKIDFNGLLYGNIIGTTTCVVNREIAKKYKMDKSFYHEDYVFWLTLLKDGYKACGISDVLVHYRLTIGSRSWNKLKMPKHRWNVYRKFLKYNRVKSLWYSAIGGIRAIIKYAGAR